MHLLDRPYQQPTYDKMAASKAPFFIAEAPTGSGKSAWAAWANYSDSQRVMVIVRTKSLQDQYKESYDFYPLKGKANYPCAKFKDRNCAQCPYHPMREAKCWSTCVYNKVLREALASNRLALNYSKILSDKTLFEKYNPDIVFLDECHQLSRVIVDYVGFDMTWEELEKHLLINRHSFNPSELPKETCFNLAMQWINNTIDGIMKLDSIDYIQEQMKSNLNTTYNQMSSEWFCRADEQGIVIKPLSARPFFNGLLEYASKTVLMSATVGNDRIFANSLYIDKYDFERVPNIWPPITRPIIDLKCPKMNHQASGKDQWQQARIIANSLEELPQEWTGIIHVSSKAKATKLYEKLSHLMSQKRIWTPKRDIGTEEALYDWLNCGAHIGVVWQFWEGVDLGNNNINILASVPHPYLGHPDDLMYERARMMNNRAEYMADVARQFEQALGRIRRGFLEHYGIGAEKFVAIADGGWVSLKGYLSKEVLDAIS